MLEVGAGSGYFSSALAAATPFLVTMDLQLAMVQRATRRLRDRGIRASAVAADAGRLPFRNQCVDRLVLVAVLGEIAAQEQFLHEAQRVLTRDGQISISEHLPDPDFIRLSSLETLLAAHGFELVSRHGSSWSYTANFRLAAA